MSSVRKRPRARPGRRPGPSSTREDILRAARRRFAHYGYDRATFRSIAADAGVDPALIVQFFGSKKDLFVAATASPVTLAEVAEASAERPERAEPGLRLARLLMEWLEDEDAREAMIGRIRSAATEPAAAELVRQMVGTQLTEFARLLVGDRAEERAALLALQFLGIVWGRHVVPLEPLASMSGEEVASWLGPTFQLYLDAPVQSPGAGR